MPESTGLCDIEDLHNDQEELDRNKIASVRPKQVKMTHKKTVKPPISDVSLDSFVPGLQSIYVKTWGCSHNSSDSEYMAGQLAACGYHITDQKDCADLWILNSCTVKTPAEQHFQNLINEAQNSGKYVVVAGCVPQAAPQTPWLKGFSMVGVQQIDRIAEVVEETLKGNSVRMLGQKTEKRKKLGGASLLLPKIRRNPLIEILAINTGCLNRCTYCKTKQARGDLGSYTIDELVDRAKQSFEEGVKEIWLTSEDLGAYGRDIGVTLPELLYQLVEVIPDGCRMRLGMTNPPYILDHLEEIADILNHPRVYKFLHIPVQSGSTAVLREMKREYTREDFDRVADFMRSKVPNVNLVTDFICGFPTESAEDFDESMDLVVKYKFASLFINQFYPRPGTPAARMKRVDTVEVKRRTKLMSEYFRSYFPYENRVGCVYEALVSEEASDGLHFVGHNDCYEQILLPKQAELMGQLVQVEIIATTRWSMEGRVIDPGKLPENVRLPVKGEVSGVDVYMRHFGEIRRPQQSSAISTSQLTPVRAYWGQICMLLALLLSFLVALWMRSRRDQ